MEFHIYRHLLDLRKPNACNIHRPVLAPLLVFALNCILNVLAALMRLSTTDGIQLSHAHRNSVARIPLNSLEYYSNCRNIGLCIHKFHCRYNAFFLLVCVFFFCSNNKIFVKIKQKNEQTPREIFISRVEKIANTNNFSMFLFLWFEFINFTWTAFRDNGTKSGRFGCPFQALWIQNFQSKR